GTERFSLAEKSIIALLITIVVVNCGVLFENRPWVRYVEWIRIALYPLLLVGAISLYSLPNYFYGVAGLYFVISGFWFSLINKQLKISYAQVV
ncbi:MAG TPA: hypothetical protein VFU05_02045, partial [Cyclobacteriaceae bacterium]|nr:hypothetical protein [Cyclobacteriaceae bacterium]